MMLETKSSSRVEEVVIIFSLRCRFGSSLGARTADDDDTAAADLVDFISGDVHAGAENRNERSVSCGALRTSCHRCGDEV